MKAGNVYLYKPYKTHFLFTGESLLRVFVDGKWEPSWAFASDITTFHPLYELVGTNLKEV